MTPNNGSTINRTILLYAPTDASRHSFSSHVISNCNTREKKNRMEVNSSLISHYLVCY